MKLSAAKFFTPNQWGSLEKFSKFYSGTYEFNESGKRALSGALSHYHKALILRNLALKLIPNLDNDEFELSEYGYTSEVNSKELSAVVESILLELYSSIDCCRKVITEIYSNYQGIPDSTQKFFNNVNARKIDNKFPEQLIIAVQEASWYDDFRKIRDELTHLETGICSKNKDTGKISYMHTGFTVQSNYLVIEDIFSEIDQTVTDVNKFLGRVFGYLLTQLKNEPMLQFCGIYQGRLYTRHVSPHEAIDFNSGVCNDYKWFELDENPTCIFVEECGAYKKAKDLLEK